jgi:amino acid adenylation domain-containing protein
LFTWQNCDMNLDLTVEVANTPVHSTNNQLNPVRFPAAQVTTDLQAGTSGDRATLALPYDSLKLPHTSYQPASVTFSFSSSLLRFLNPPSSSDRTTSAAFFLAVFAALLHRYTQQEGVELDCNFLAAQPDRNFTARIAPSISSKLTVQALFQHIFSLLINAEILSGDAPQLSCADVAFTYSQATSLPTQSETFHPEAAQPDLHLQILQNGSDLQGRFEYNAHLFQHSTIIRIAGHLCQMLEGAVANLDRPIAELPLLTSAEEDQFYKEWSSLSVRYPQEPIFKVIEKHAVQRPNAIAVTYKDQHLTYAELNQKANQLAHFLNQLGVQPGVRVASCMEPSLEVLVGILAVFKAGGVYVPLDPSHPAERLTAMLEDTQPQVLLTQSHLAAVVPAVAASVLYLDQDWTNIQSQPTHNPEHPIALEQTAYIIYTSGTTGKPKGVMASHANLINYIWVAQEKYGFNSQDVMPAIARFTFSITMFELWSPLVAGGTLVLLEREHILDFKRMVKTLQQVTFVHISPSLWRKLLAYIQETGIDTQTFNNLRHVSSGGDMVPADLLETMKAVFTNAEVYVIYGCSEISCMGCTYPVLRDRTLTKTKVGKPFNNVSVRLYDPYQNLVPIGVVGEIYFGGAGITQGYLNREELTQEKFVTIDGQRYYRTGDLGRFDEAGNLEILGRSDYQIKLRGIRMEPGEIEAALRKAPGVREGVVVARELGKSEKSLVAYIVSNSLQTPNKAEIRRFLQTKLPDYMVPSVFVVLDALPVNINQKVDRQALPLPTPDDLAGSQQFVAPRDEVEQQLTEIWETALGISPIGVEDDFFEIGGDSLQSIALMMKIEEAFGKTLPLSTLLTEPTIAQMADVLRESQPSDIHKSIVLLRKGGSKPPIFFIHDGEGETIPYRQLALNLDSEHPIYGIQPYSRDGFPMLHTRLTEMVEFYTEQIRSVQPEGPYLLSGLCIGGFLAFEIARKLHREGQTVKMVALLDAADVKASVRTGLVTNQRLDGFSQSLRQGQQLSARQRLFYLLKTVWQKIINLLVYEATSRSAATQRKVKLKLFRYYLDRGWSLPRFLSNIPVWAVLRFAEKEYVPAAPYPGEVVLFRATQRSSVFDGTMIDDTPYTEIFSDPLLGWEERAERVKVCDMPGGHSSMLQDPNVQVIAETMQAYLQAVL